MLKKIIERHISPESPHWLQKLYGNCGLIFNFADVRMRAKKTVFRRFLMRSQWFSPAELEQYQLERLQLLIRHVHQNVPYYHDIFRKNNLYPDDFRLLKDLKKFPILTREDIINNFDKLVSRKAEKKRLTLKSTSGSTGTPVSFYRDDREEGMNQALFDRAFAAIGARMYWKSIWFRERPFIERQLTARYIYEPRFQQLTLPVHHCGSDFWEKNIDLIKKYKPAYILANPYLLYDLALYVQDNKIGGLRFKFIMSAFENLYPHQRKAIEEQFQCKVYSHYECQERAVSGFECERQSGFHVDMEKSVVEIIDKDGRDAPRGKQGQLITTSLRSFSMPLIRYEIGDTASFSDVQCGCGRGLQLLQCLNGRASLLIRCRDKALCENDLSFAVMRCKQIKAIQFIQESEKELLVNIVRKPGFAEDDARDLTGYLHSLFGESMQIRIHFTDVIANTRMGKFPLVISKLSRQNKNEKNE